VPLFREFARILKPGGRLVLVDSLQRGDEPDYDGLLDLFPQIFMNHFIRAISKRTSVRSRAIAISSSRAATRAFVSKVMVFDMP